MLYSQTDTIQAWLPRLQAHRGCWVRGERQNTLASIKQAFELGYEMTEFDVRLTQDNVVVLFHDSSYKNQYLSNITFKQLNDLILTTTLEELFDWFLTTQNFKLNIEIKNRSFLNYKLEKTVSDLIKNYKLEDRVLVSSFNFVTLIKMRLFSPRVYRAFLLSFERHKEVQFKMLFWLIKLLCYPQMLNLRYNDLTVYFKKLAKNIPIVLWTVNDVVFVKENKDYIHGIISDSITPEIFSEALNA